MNAVFAELSKKTNLLGILAGLLLGAASPPGLFPGAEFLGLFGLALLFWLGMQHEAGRLSFWLCGYVYYLWISWSLRHLFYWVPVIAIPLAGAWYFVLLAKFWRYWERRFGRASLPFAFAASYAFYEWLKGHIPVIPYPHAQVAHAIYEWPDLLRPVHVVGEAGMNFLFVLLAAGLVPGFTRKTRAVTLATSLAVWGLASFSGPGSTLDEHREIRVALGQTGQAAYPGEPGYRRGWGEREKLESLKRKAIQAFAAQPVDLFVWPESSIGGSFSKATEGKIYPEIAALGGGSDVLLGAGRLEAIDPDPQKAEASLYDRRNCAYLLTRKGRVVGHHEKRRLVPMGETVPLISALLPKRWRLELHDWIGRMSHWYFPEPGEKQPLLRLSEGTPFGSVICFENCYPGLFREMANEGARFFCVLSNENFYSGGAELDQMLAMTVFRAMETGRDVVRSTTNGWTVHVNPDGRVVKSRPLWQPATLKTLVRARSGSSLAMQTGPWLHWLFFAVLLFCCVFGKRGTENAPTPSGV